jgi:hypothetical protein
MTTPTLTDQTVEALLQQVAPNLLAAFINL